MTLLEARGLSLSIHGTPILRSVDLGIAPGETLGLVGESGSGKSMTALAAMQLLPDGAEARGSLHLAGADLLAMPEAELCCLRGRRIGMVFQEPMTALNPVKTIGAQIAEGLIWHLGLSRAEAAERAGALLDRVGLTAAGVGPDRFPHQLSGGQRQRVVIALAIACDPELLIADEPTTALDVTIQAQVLELISDIRARLGMSVVLITHDLGVVAEHCDRVMVMYAGQVVEEGATVDVIANPRHPYTRGLLASIPRLSMRGQPIQPIEGQVPNLVGLPPQCRFYSRCPDRGDGCLQTVAMRSAGPGRRARCIAIAEEAVA